MTLRNSSLSVDFGDDVIITVSLQRGVAIATNNTQDTNIGDSMDGDDGEFVRISDDNYGLTCQLHVELSHMHTSEGDFNVSVEVRAAGVEEPIVACNWTILIVQSRIENVSVLIDRVVTAQRNVTVEALVSPVSQFLKYHWAVSGLEFMTETNTPMILSTITDVPQLQLMLTNAGDYLINVTVSNAVSTAFDGVIITAAVPISALSLSCSDDKYFLINAKLDCVATVKEGTDVEFMWNFDVGNSIHTTTSNGSSVATVAFSDVGQYNMTVTAWNHLSTETAWKTVDVAETVFKLITLATEPAVIGKPVSVTACSVSGANLTVEFDFGGSRHHLVLDTESRLVTASHVYLHPGPHNVTVTAENSIAMEVLHVTVRVLDHMHDADIKPMSVLVTGRRSVFMAVFNGNFVCFFVLKCFIYLTRHCINVK